MIFWNWENEQFSMTNYSKTIRRRKKIPDDKRLLIVWNFHNNMNNKLYLLFKLQILQIL